MLLYRVEMKSKLGPEDMAKRCRSGGECLLWDWHFHCPFGGECEKATAEGWAARLLEDKTQGSPKESVTYGR